MNYDRKLRALTALSSVIAVALGASAAHAQDQEPQGLEEIVVTAQKRSESLQDVPIAISAFSDKDLSRMSGNVMEQVARSSPNVYFQQSDSMKSSKTKIRGISAVSNTAGSDPSVGYYLDEVYLGGTVGNNIDLYDVERVEVLRGPQGTLFGRNTMGGVISVTSRRPSNRLEGYAEAQFGNYNLQRYKASVSGPLVEDKLAVSLSGTYYDRDGYLFNANLQRDTNDAHQYGGRASVLFTPSDQAEFLLSFDYRKVDQTGQSQETYANNPAAMLSFTHANFNPTDRQVFGDFIGRETFEGWGTSLNARLKFGGVDLVSVTGYRSHDYLVEGESDQVPFGIGRNFDPESVDMFTQELRLQSNGDGKLRWVAGVYYYDNHAVNDGGIVIQKDLLDLFGAGFLAPLYGGSRGDTKTTSWAVFGSLDYAITDKLTLTVGGRYTHDKKVFSWDQRDLEAVFGDPILGGTGTASGSRSWSKFTPAVTVNYRANPDVMFYGTVSQGYKGGGFNDGSGVPSQQSTPYDPETMWNYEIGMKSSFMDNRLVLNIAAFKMDWRDIQVRADDPSTPNSFDPRLSNAGKAHSNGLEVELKALLGDRFTLQASGAYLDTGYDEGEIPVGVGQGIPLVEFAQAPEFSYSLSGEYVQPISDKVEAKFRLEWQGQSKTYLTVDSRDPYRVEPGYGVLNGRITIGSPDDRWRVSLWALNLTDKTYRISAFDLYNNGLVGQYFSILGAPRTYGVDLRFGF